MRNVLLVLLLANFIVFVWERWVIAPERAVPETTAADILALTTIADPVEAPAAEPAAAAAPGVARCMEFGPFAADNEVSLLESGLQSQGISASRRQEAADIWVGNWVQLRGYPDRSAAEADQARLAEGGMVDTYVLSGPDGFSLSLGVFRSDEGAGRVAQTARSLGFEPSVSARTRPGSNYWVTARISADARLDLNRLQQDVGQILRSRDVACPLVASVEPDSLESAP